jgi:virulence-associated protein VagC
MRKRSRADTEIRPITAGGQISLPAAIRHRWRATHVLIKDHGESVVLEPIEDPIAWALGRLAGPGPTSEEMREQSRAEDAEEEDRRWSYLKK